MRQNVKERLNKKLSDNNMTTLNDKSVAPLQPEQLPKRLHRNRTYDNAKCQDRLINNIDNEGIPYGHGQYDDRQYDNYYTLQDPIEPTPTFLQSITPGNEQLIIIILAGLAAYTLYIFSKSKDKP